MIEKIMSVVSIGGTVANVALLQRFLSGVTVVVALTVISAFMIGLMLTGLFGALYFCLVHYGLLPEIAALMVALFALLMTITLAVIVILRVKHLRGLPSQMLRKDLSSLAPLGEVLESFINGFMSRGPSIKP